MHNMVYIKLVIFWLFGVSLLIFKY